MKFCTYKWSAPHYKENDPEGRPSTFKDQFCELEENHTGPHRSMSNITAPNPKPKRSNKNNDTI